MWTLLTLLQLKATWWPEPGSSHLRSRSHESLCECESWEARKLYTGKRIHRDNVSPERQESHWLISRRVLVEQSSLFLLVLSGHNCKCSLASPDAFQSPHTNAALKIFTELWIIQRLAQMPRNLYTSRTRDAGQDSTWDCFDAKTVCPTSRQTVSYWVRFAWHSGHTLWGGRTRLAWDRLSDLPRPTEKRESNLLALDVALPVLGSCAQT